MKRKNPLSKEVNSENGVHSPKPTNMTIHYRNPMAQKCLRRPNLCMVAMSCWRPSLSGPACPWIPHGFSCVGVSFPPLVAAGERSEYNIKPPLGAPLLICPRGYLLKSFPQVDTSTTQRGFEIRVFPLQVELPKAIDPHLPVCQLYRWQLGPSMWSSPTTKSISPIVVTALRVGFPGEATDPLHVDLPDIVRSQRRGQRWRQGTIYI